MDLIVSKKVNGVALYTDEGLKVLGLDSNGKPYTIDGCFYDCNSHQMEQDNRTKANTLKIRASLVDKRTRRNKDWYKDIKNFKPIFLTVQFPNLF